MEFEHQARRHFYWLCIPGFIALETALIAQQTVQAAAQRRNRLPSGQESGAMLCIVNLRVGMR